MSSDFLSGTVSTPTVYHPTPKDRYTLRAVDADITDPVAAGWADETMSEEWRKAPFGRIRWQITGDKNGGPVDCAGRIVDQRISFTAGYNPKTGRSNLESLADLIRLAKGMTAKDEVVGMSLFDTSDLKDMERVDFLNIAGQRFKDAVVGLETVGVVGWKKVKGEDQDRVVKLVVPKGK